MAHTRAVSSVIPQRNIGRSSRSRARGDTTPVSLLKNITNVEMVPNPIDDPLYPPTQRLRFALEDLAETRKLFHKVQSEEPTAQSIFNYATITTDPLITGGQEKANPYIRLDEKMCKPDEATKRIDRDLKENEKKFASVQPDRSIAETNEIHLIVLSCPYDITEAHIWYGIDLKQPPVAIQLTYQRNYYAKGLEILRHLVFIRKQMGIPFSGAAAEVFKFLDIISAEEAKEAEERALNAKAKPKPKVQDQKAITAALQLLRPCLDNLRDVTVPFWADKEVKQLFYDFFAQHKDRETYEYILNNIEWLMGKTFSPSLADFIINSVADGQNAQSLQNSVNSFYESYMELPTPSGVHVILFDLAPVVEQSIKTGSILVPCSEEPNRAFPGPEALFKSILQRKNFNGKYYFDAYDSSDTKQTGLDVVIRRAREFILSVRQDRIMDITS